MSKELEVLGLEEQALIGNVTSAARSQLDLLCVLDSLTPLCGSVRCHDINVTITHDESSKSMFPAKIKEPKGKKTLEITYDPDTVADLGHYYYFNDPDESEQDMQTLYLGAGLANHLIARRLSPISAIQDDFLVYMTQPAGFFSEAIESGLVRSNDNYEIVRQIIVNEDEERLAHINGLRLAFGATYMINGPEFTARMKQVFLSQLMASFDGRSEYTASLSRFFQKDAEEAAYYFIQHISDIELAGALPMDAKQVEHIVREYCTPDGI